MVLWEIMVLMIAATICISAGISFIVDQILNAIDKYKTRRTVRNTKMLSEIVKELPQVFETCIEKMKEKKE